MTTFRVQTQSGGEISDHMVRFAAAAPRAGSPARIACIVDGAPVELNWLEVEPGVYSILSGARSTTVVVYSEKPGAAAAMAANGRRTIALDGYTVRAEVSDPRTRRKATTEQVHGGTVEIVAPMPGRVVNVLVQERDHVNQGDGLVIVEAMKMQNELRAPRAGTVMKVHVRQGAGVESGAKLLSVG